MVNFDNLITTIIKPLVKFPDDIKIDHRETAEFHEYILTPNPQDVGRVIGKRGRVAQTIRAIVYSIHVPDHKRVKLIIDDGK
ncbi:MULTISPECIES: KH domain-containing protein [Fructilactobacillus]|uniref:RNA-binding protein KhpA n=2 Tax=Fructilactobacillus TaxID=2767881 RepID=A0A9Q8ZQE1_9LACO|nr:MULTISPECIES: KH domain-containing protein [Fructilactobacillus]USS86683.1 KH domain-containing protein [Fructilactobacillus cliffordii]USS89679.1 KH domain-containing protein [Fructilactobacillus cliffordii]USS91121.1 KH domain-containing protein [Fructilactobacillus carniphilus]